MTTTRALSILGEVKELGGRVWISPEVTIVAMNGAATWGCVEVTFKGKVRWFDKTIIGGVIHRWGVGDVARGWTISNMKEVWRGHQLHAYGDFCLPLEDKVIKNIIRNISNGVIADEKKFGK